MRGDDRRPRPAAPPRQGHRLGHRRVLDAAAGDRRADRPRVGQGQDRRPDPRDPAPHRALAARRRRPDPARRADDHRRLRRPPGRRRDADRVDHRRLRRAGRGAHHLRHGAPPRRPRSRRLASGSSTACRCSTSTTREDSRADVDFNVVGTDAGAYVELQGTAEGKPFDRAAADGLLDLADAGLAQLFAAQAADPRHRPAVTRRRPTAAPGRHPLGAQAARAARAARSSTHGELVSLDDLGIAGRPGRGRRDVRDERRDQGPLRGAATRPADARRRLRPRGRRARRRPGRPDPALRRRGRDRRRQQREAARARSTACRRSDAARATCACSPWPSRTTRVRAAALPLDR